VLFGPYNFSFQDTVADLVAADAGVEVRDPDELPGWLNGLIRKPVRRNMLGQRAREVVLNGQGATERNLELLLTMFDMAAACSGSTDNAQCRHQTSGHIVNE
jgi:3-deoxy-D-manno-octulosonic-acid transferase